jgi:aspartyl-tRNA(Asn)/glutamyl-tRNA(Gln) amidotransferase subunit A
VETAIGRLAELGVRVDETAFPAAVQAEQDADNLVLLRTEAYTYHREMLRTNPEGFSDRVRARLELDANVLAADLIDIQRRRASLTQSATASLSELDAVVAPTMLTTAPRLADLDKGEPAKLVTRLVNWLGLCAVSVPCGFCSDGLPVGLQLIGKPFDEARILRLAFAYEQATDWHRHTPPGF